MIDNFVKISIVISLPATTHPYSSDVGSAFESGGSGDGKQCLVKQQTILYSSNKKMDYIFSRCNQIQDKYP